jgi:Fe-S-cluster-containing hydrogenase component 2
MSFIIVDADKCSGCKICSLICAITHFKINNPRKGAIQIKSEFPQPGKNIPVLCTQCAAFRTRETDRKLCIDVCPNKAIYITNDHRVLVNPEKCTGVYACVAACPMGAMFTHRDIKTPIKCDLCGGNPTCVKYCPTGALSLRGKK